MHIIIIFVRLTILLCLNSYWFFLYILRKKQQKKKERKKLHHWPGWTSSTSKLEELDQTQLARKTHHDPNWQNNQRCFQLIWHYCKQNRGLLLFLLNWQTLSWYMLPYGFYYLPLVSIGMAKRVNPFNPMAGWRFGWSAINKKL